MLRYIYDRVAFCVPVLYDLTFLLYLKLSEQKGVYTCMSLTNPLVTLLYTSFILCTKHLMCICNIMNSIIWRC